MDASKTEHSHESSEEREHVKYKTPVPVLQRGGDPDNETETNKWFTQNNIAVNQDEYMKIFGNLVKQYYGDGNSWETNEYPWPKIAYEKGKYVGSWKNAAGKVQEYAWYEEQTGGSVKPALWNGTATYMSSQTQQLLFIMNLRRMLRLK